MKKIKEQTNLSSSEDERVTNILKEAIDQQFLNNDLYSMEKAKVIPQFVKTNKLDEKPLRINSKQDDKFINFGVTSTFQRFVAKKLDEILERTIKLENSETTGCCGKQKQGKNKISGIKLLSTSKKFLTIAELGEECTEHRKTLTESRQITEDDEALLKFREAAIDPECILSKSDTKAWINKHMEPEFKYKRLKSGTLTEM